MEQIAKTKKKVVSKKTKETPQTVIKVILGGKEYQIRPLVIREAREWRQKLAEIVAVLPKYVTVSSDTPDKFAEAIKGLFSSMPDSIGDLFFAYAKDLNREEIEATATDQELITAFLQLNETTSVLVRVVPAIITGLVR